MTFDVFKFATGSSKWRITDRREVQYLREPCGLDKAGEEHFPVRPVRLLAPGASPGLELKIPTHSSSRIE